MLKRNNFGKAIEKSSKDMHISIMFSTSSTVILQSEFRYCLDPCPFPLKAKYFDVGFYHSSLSQILPMFSSHTMTSSVIS